MKTLQKKYGLKDPQQIKMRIIWMALKQLLTHAFGNDAKNRKVIEQFDEQWKRCERGEN